MNGYGTNFDDSYKLKRSIQPRNSFLWPRPSEPGASSIRLWRSALQKCFGLNNGFTGHTLGRWLHNNYDGWNRFYDPRTSLIYERHGNSWKFWRRISRAGNLGLHPLYKYHNNAFRKPNSARRCTCSYVGISKIRFEGWSDDFQDDNIFHTRQPKIENYKILAEVRTGDIQELIQSIQRGNCIAVSDGTYFPETQDCAASWLIESITSPAQIQGNTVL